MARNIPLSILHAKPDLRMPRGSPFSGLSCFSSAVATSGMRCPAAIPSEFASQQSEIPFPLENPMHKNEDSFHLFPAVPPPPHRNSSLAERWPKLPLASLADLGSKP